MKKPRQTRVDNGRVCVGLKSGELLEVPEKVFNVYLFVLGYESYFSGLLDDKNTNPDWIAGFWLASDHDLEKNGI